MGLFDDNKYVTSLKKEFAEKEEKDNAAMQAEEVDMAIEAMQGCADLASLQGIFGGAWKRCGESEKQRLQTAYENLKACFLQAIPDDEKEAA
ncbi:hypothetical protein [Paludibacterium denitrificans]|uniref:Uncharacterized protein n=1 Tax=Paludibacterium denitrificans TaxID=2675226 RepID=A0A844GH48_9NEIS|nr:hypothetical protein [Paludibacterium denitrificans]MTD33994.1 hypothetical protein [Paludibacterium denitrificans]